MASLRRRLDLNHRSVVFFRQNVNQSVRSLADVSDALMEVLQDRFPAQFPQFLVEDNALHSAGAGNPPALDAADKDIALPLRELVARIEDQARRRDARVPGDPGRLDALARPPSGPSSA